MTRLKVSQETSVEATFVLAPEEAQLLLRLAFMAIGRKRFSSADQILTALEAFRPGDEALIAARAVADISRKAFTDCRHRLEEARLHRGCLPPMLALFYGIALGKSGEPETARQIWQTVARQTEALPAARFAQDLLA